MSRTIEDMLKDGMSLDEIMKEAKKIQAEQEKKNVRQKEIDVARQQVLDAIDAYMDILGFEKSDDAIAKELVETFKLMEMWAPGKKTRGEKSKKPYWF